MTRANYCEFFRFHDKWCDVYTEDDHYLYVECEPYGWADMLTCKEFTPSENGGYIVSAYSAAAPAYLQTLQPAPEAVALDIIASEERYTLECMAIEYGYTRQHVVDAYLECRADGETPHEAFVWTKAAMMEYDL